MTDATASIVASRPRCAIAPVRRTLSSAGLKQRGLQRKGAALRRAPVGGRSPQGRACILFGPRRAFIAAQCSEEPQIRLLAREWQVARGRGC